MFRLHVILMERKSLSLDIKSENSILLHFFHGDQFIIIYYKIKEIKHQFIKL